MPPPQPPELTPRHGASPQSHVAPGTPAFTTVVVAYEAHTARVRIHARAPPHAVSAAIAKAVGLSGDVQVLVRMGGRGAILVPTARVLAAVPEGTALHVLPPAERAAPAQSRKGSFKSKLFLVPRLLLLGSMLAVALSWTVTGPAERMDILRNVYMGNWQASGHPERDMMVSGSMWVGRTSGTGDGDVSVKRVMVFGERNSVACTAAIHGTISYSDTLGKLEICTNGAWVALSVFRMPTGVMVWTEGTCPSPAWETDNTFTGFSIVGDFGGPGAHGSALGNPGVLTTNEVLEHTHVVSMSPGGGSTTLRTRTDISQGQHSHPFAFPGSGHTTPASSNHYHTYPVVRGPGPHDANGLTTGTNGSPSNDGSCPIPVSGTNSGQCATPTPSHFAKHNPTSPIPGCSFVTNNWPHTHTIAMPNTPMPAAINPAHPTTIPVEMPNLGLRLCVKKAEPT